MGISLDMIEKMQHLGLFGRGRISILDIGSSNLYSATGEGICRFLAGYGIEQTKEVAAFAERLALGSAYDSVSGGVNGAFVGELFEKVNLGYDAIDIADGFRTTILDLNHEPAPAEFVGAFDLVLNFGTTEHLLNQYNAFKVMHDSTKLGGYIVNSLPCVGYSNHGYITYTPRCMFDLAAYNEYELVAFWFEGPGNNNDLFAPIRDYQSYFPNLSHTLAKRDTTEVGRQIAQLALPDVGLTAVFRKTKARPFLGALERSTSVGLVPVSVTAGYESGRRGGVPAGTNTGCEPEAAPIPAGVPAWAKRFANSFRWMLRHGQPGNTSGRFAGGKNRASIVVGRHEEIVLKGEAEDLRNRFVQQSDMTFEECMLFYTLVTDTHGNFPYDWEYRILLLAIEREPGRRDLSDRLAFVEGQL